MCDWSLWGFVPGIVVVSVAFIVVFAEFGYFE